MANRSFQLKPSYFSLGFHFVTGIIILFFSFQLLAWWLSLIILALLCLSYAHFFAQNKIQYLDYLDQKEWTLIDVAQQKQRAELVKIIDHHIYIVLYFKDVKNPVVVWRDQLNLQQWKNLKILAGLV